MLILSPNCIEYAIAFFACLAAGGTVTTCNPAYTLHELSTQLKDCKPAYVIGHQSCINTIEKVEYSFRKIIVIGQPSMYEHKYLLMTDLFK